MPDDPPIPNQAKITQDTLDMLSHKSEPPTPMQVTVWGRRPHLWRNSKPTWLLYYWNLIKCMGRESYRTWRGEMWASVIIAFFAYIFAAPEDHGAFDMLVVVLKATGAGLCVMGLWHLIRAPWLAERDRGKQLEHGWFSGVFGLLIVAAVIAGGLWVISALYREHQTLTSKNRTLVEQDKRLTEQYEGIKSRPVEVKYVTPEPPKESPNSLRRRTLKLVNDLVLFWSQRPSPQQQPVQNPTNDEERHRNDVWAKYWRDAGAAYANAGFRERVLGIVRQYKAKGLETGFLEQAAEQPERLVGSYSYGGSDLNGCWRYMTELCQFRELAYHVDANDEMIILGPKAQTPQ